MAFNFFDEAIAAHLDWKRRLRSCLDGSGTCPRSDQAVNDGLCELGKWLFGEGRQYANLPSYGELLQQHARFHVESAKILLLIEADRFEEAEQMLLADGPFLESSAEVVGAIGRLRADIDKLVLG